MRLHITMTANADFEYSNQYRQKLAGRMWKAVRGTRFQDRHDESVPLGITMSNPYPPRRVVREGNTLHLDIAAAERDLLQHIGASLTDEEILTLGEMRFTVDDITAENPDVGPPGTRGEITTPTGVLVRLEEDDREKYGISRPSRSTEQNTTFWKPKHPNEAFFDSIRDNLSFKHQYFEDESLPSPNDVDEPLFENSEVEGRHAVDTAVTSGGDTLTHIVTDWTFTYRVRDQHHRRHLNLALNTGLGERTGLGFGHCNLNVSEVPQ